MNEYDGCDLNSSGSLVQWTMTGTVPFSERVPNLAQTFNRNIEDGSLT
jgi:hypothetical protein